MRRGAAFIVVLGLTLVACGGDDDAEETGDSTTTTESDSEDTTTTDPEATEASPGTPEEQALAVYAAANDYIDRAFSANPPQAAGLEISEYFSGAAMSETMDQLNGLVAENVYLAMDVTTHPVVVTPGESEVFLTDCLVQVVTEFDAATGQPKSSEGQFVVNLHVWVRLGATGWRVDQIETQDRPCTP